MYETWFDKKSKLIQNDILSAQRNIKKHYAGFKICHYLNCMLLNGEVLKKYLWNKYWIYVSWLNVICITVLIFMFKGIPIMLQGGGEGFSFIATRLWFWAPVIQ